MKQKKLSKLNLNQQHRQKIWPKSANGTWIKQNIILMFLLIVISTAQAQTGNIRGFIYEKKTGEPLPFANVFLKGTTYGAFTDINGYYTISRIPVGKYTLMATSLGYDTVAIPVLVQASKTIEQNLTLAQSAVQLEEFVISAERQDQRSQVYTSLIKISPKQIEMLPSVGGERDIAQFLQVIPGVVFTGDQGGQLYIRGGAPIQNKVLLDGMVIYNPFHSIGLFSVFDSDILRNSDVYTGGFNAEYGGRISAVMDLTTRDGNKKQFSGKISTNTMTSKILLEGPLKKMKDDEFSSISYLLSAKKSYIEWAGNNIYQHLDTTGLPFDFTDIFAKISLNGKMGNKLNVFGFSFNDRVNNFNGISDFRWNNVGGGISSILVPSGSSTMITTGVNYSNYAIQMSSSDNLPRESSISNFGFNMNFTYHLGEDDFKYGLELQNLRTEYQYTNEFNYSQNFVQTTSEIAAFAKYKWTIGNLILDPGIRFTNYSSLSESTFEPRFGLKWSITEKIRFKFSGGTYSQNLIATNSDRDVVNLFYGFISAPESELSYQNTVVGSYLQKSIHGVAGFEFDFSNALTANAETYYKRFNQLINLNRNVIYPDDNRYIDKPTILKKDLVIEYGDAYGIDFLVKYNKNQFYLWLVYSLGYTNHQGEFININNQIYEKRYPTHYDRRHNINFVGSYAFGHENLWEISCRWNFGSGYPYTPTQGFYEEIIIPDIDVDYTTLQGTLALIYGDINSKRLPTYHRLDLNLKRTIPFKGESKLVFDLGATNVYNRKNIFFFHRIQNKPVYQLPIMPSFGMSLTF